MPLCKVTREDYELMRVMRSSGMTLHSIGAIFHIGHQTVSYNLGQGRKTVFRDPAPTKQQLVAKLRSIADNLENTL